MEKGSDVGTREARPNEIYTLWEKQLKLEEFTIDLSGFHSQPFNYLRMKTFPHEFTELQKRSLRRLAQNNYKTLDGNLHYKVKSKTVLHGKKVWRRVVTDEREKQDLMKSIHCGKTT